MRVRLTDIARVGPVLNAALGAGANRLEGVEFSLEDDGALRREALAQAVTEARGKAEAMAAALGVALGPVQNAHEGGVSVRPVQAEMARDRAMLMAMDAPTPVAPGHVVVVAHVTLQYRLG